MSSELYNPAWRGAGVDGGGKPSMSATVFLIRAAKSSTGETDFEGGVLGTFSNRGSREGYGFSLGEETSFHRKETPFERTETSILMGETVSGMVFYRTVSQSAVAYTFSS